LAIDTAQKRAGVLGIRLPRLGGGTGTDDDISSEGVLAHSWVSATSVASGVSDNWTDPANAHDGDTATFAVEKSKTAQEYLELNFDTPKRAEKWRFIGHQYLDPVEANPEIEVWLYYNGGWQIQYAAQQSLTKDEWYYDFVFGDWHTPRLISAVRIRSENTSFFLRVHEFQLLDVGGYIPTVARPKIGGTLVGNLLVNGGLIEGAGYLGDFPADQTIRFKWSAHDVRGYRENLAVGGEVRVYKNDDTTQSTAGVTTTQPFDQVNGVFHTTIVTTDSFYVEGADYFVVVANCNVDSQAISTPIAQFSIGNRTGGRGHGNIEYTYTVRARDESIGPVIEGVDCWITKTNSSTAPVVFRGFTDANGVLRNGATGRKPRLDAGTWFFWCEKSGYTFNNPDSQVVS
jgi:hypothetical protein